MTDALDRIITLSLERSIPMGPISRRIGYSGGEEDRFLYMLKGRCEDADIDFFDLSGPPFLPVDALFRDGRYLSHRGARVVSKQVAREILAPVLKEMK